MATKAQIAANRRNAQRSTGPRSAAGKADVARNALRHGLAARIVEGATASDRVRQLADAFIGDGPRSEAIEGLARIAAEAQHVIEQVHRVRALIFQKTEAKVRPYHNARKRRAMARLKQTVEAIDAEVLRGGLKPAILDFIAMQEAAESPWQPESETDRQAVILQQVVGRLVRLDRYERRALSRRRRALNDLQEAQRTGGAGGS